MLTTNKKDESSIRSSLTATHKDSRFVDPDALLASFYKPPGAIWSYFDATDVEKRDRKKAISIKTRFSLLRRGISIFLHNLIVLIMKTIYVLKAYHLR